jgi:exonuclease SbcC
VLSNILGLELWEEYKNKTADKRKSLEREVDEIDGRIREIDAELAEEDLRKARLAELEASLQQLTVQRTAQDSVLENIRRNAALIGEQRKMTVMLSERLERERSACAGLEERLAAKQADRDSYADLVQRAREIESLHKSWQKSRKALEEWDRIASQFRDYEKERAPLLEIIAVEKAKLEAEQRSLLIEEETIRDQKLTIEDLQSEIEQTEISLKDAEAKVMERLQLESERNAARERQAELKAENEALKADMNELKERIDSLKAAQGASCPLCGQELSVEHRVSTLVQLEREGKQKGDRFRANQAESAELSKQITNYELQITKLSSAENERVQYASEGSLLTERMETLRRFAREWETAGKKRLKEVEKILATGKYAVEEQKQLAKLEKKLEKLGYDVSAHDAARDEEMELRAVEEEYANLKSAREVSQQIQSEIARQISTRRNANSSACVKPRTKRGVSWAAPSNGWMSWKRCEHVKEPMKRNVRNCRGRSGDTERSSVPLAKTASLPC